MFCCPGLVPNTSCCAFLVTWPTVFHCILVLYYVPGFRRCFAGTALFLVVSYWIPGVILVLFFHDHFGSSVVRLVLLNLRQALVVVLRCVYVRGLSARCVPDDSFIFMLYITCTYVGRQMHSGRLICFFFLRPLVFRFQYRLSSAFRQQLGSVRVIVPLVPTLSKTRY